MILYKALLHLESARASSYTFYYQTEDFKKKVENRNETSLERKHNAWKEMYRDMYSAWGDIYIYVTPAYSVKQTMIYVKEKSQTFLGHSCW